ncbi:hypothetical protein [Streptomyces spirodelae]|uniref:Pectate lyase n=1 Tax=Streptomyces spirodelae TaxID=2812904 RepID=A0ABS3X223_9ACTN|nr:hypothetical protein [Streptomyces spirodelae]MBO8189440.1 hypothetical protein [Streptomyces spirodelae]
MRIRTATAATLLATAAVFGAAGTAFAGDHADQYWTTFAQDYSDRSLNARISSSDNDTTDIKKFQVTNITDNEVRPITAGAAIGKIVLD